MSNELREKRYGSFTFLPVDKRNMPKPEDPYEPSKDIMSIFNDFFRGTLMAVLKSPLWLEIHVEQIVITVLPTRVLVLFDTPKTIEIHFLGVIHTFEGISNLTNAETNGKSLVSFTFEKYSAKVV